LSPEEFRLFVFLLVNADDYGRFDGRATVIKGSCLPLFDTRLNDIDKMIDHMTEVGLVSRYNVAGKPFLQLVTWAKHQRIRNSKEKYPSPVHADPVSDSSPRVAASCGELRRVAASCGDLPQNAAPARGCGSNPIQSNPNPIQDSSNDKAVTTSPETEPVSEPVMFKLPLQDHTEYEITESYYHQLAELYPAVDIDQEFRKMFGWLDAAPARRKTRVGIKRFITNWLSREQDKGGSRFRPSVRSPATPVEQFAARAERWANGAQGVHVSDDGG